MLCSFCAKHEADPRYREVIGWEQVRRGGGLHALIGKKTTGRVACTSCIIDIRTGLPPNSLKLFDAEP